MANITSRSERNPLGTNPAPATIPIAAGAGGDEATFRELVEALPILVWTCRADGVCDYLSPQWLRYTGLDDSSLSLECLIHSIHPDDRPQSLAQWQHSVDHGIAYDASFRLRRADGKYRWFKSRGTPVFDDHGRIRRWFGTCFDIEEQKELEDTLRARDSHMREIFENLIVGCQILDHDLRYVYVNVNAAQHGRVDRDKLLGRFMRDVYPGIENTDIYQHIQNCLRTGQSERLDNQFHFSDGSIGIFELSIQPVPEGVLIVSADVTQERQLADKLLQSQKLEAIGRLAGGVSHDFNNLLTVIQGHCDMLEQTAISDAQRESIMAIRGAGSRASRLTRQLLAFSRHAFVHAEIFSINKMLVKSADFMQSLLGEGIQLSLQLAPDLERLCIDRNQFEQVVMNLLLNARDAMPQGGELTISTKNIVIRRSGDSPLPDLKPGHYALITFADTGIGMTEEVLSRIFEPFFTTKEVGRGTGLGLPVVHGAVTQAGGHISVTSEVGKGSVFQIFYPSNSAVPKAEPLHKSTEHDCNKRILLVEDEDSVRKIVRISLEKQGCSITECNGPEQALTVAEQSPAYDLLVTDVVMPNMRGPELASAMRQLTPELRVLYMSGYADESIGLKQALLTGDDFLQKPFSPMELLERVRRLLES